MSKSLVLFGCLFSNVVIFGECCCGEKEDVELQLEFKKLVMKCFGVQEKDILLLYDSRCTHMFFYDRKDLNQKAKKDKMNVEKINGFKYAFFHRKKEKYVCCFVKGNIKPKSDEFKDTEEMRSIPPPDLELNEGIYVRASDYDDNKHRMLYRFKV